MLDTVAKYSLDLLTVLAIVIVGAMALKWSSMPVLQRLCACFFIGIVAHIWEESRFPGGFTDLVAAKLGFTASNPHFGELILAFVVLVVVFVPILFPRTAFLCMAPLLLGCLEAIAHTAAIWIFKLDRLYSPGLVTALLVLLPISTYGISYAVRHKLVRGSGWLFALLYMFVPLVLAQRVVVAASGMTYLEFLRNLKAHF